MKALLPTLLLTKLLSVIRMCLMIKINAMKESSKHERNCRERMAGENPYGVHGEAVPEQGSPKAQ